MLALGFCPRDSFWKFCRFAYALLLWPLLTFYFINVFSVLTFALYVTFLAAFEALFILVDCTVVSFAVAALILVETIRHRSTVFCCVTFLMTLRARRAVVLSTHTLSCFKIAFTGAAVCGLMPVSVTPRTLYRFHWFLAVACKMPMPVAVETFLVLKGSFNMAISSLLIPTFLFSRGLSSWSCPPAHLQGFSFFL